VELGQGPWEDEHTESIDMIVLVITNMKEYSVLIVQCIQIIFNIWMK
jgi:hypothetical protein